MASYSLSGSQFTNPGQESQFKEPHKDTEKTYFLLKIIYMFVFLSLSHVQLFLTPWTIAHQDPLCTGPSTQEHWNGLPFSPPGDLPDPGIKPMSPVTPALQADS